MRLHPSCRGPSVVGYVMLSTMARVRPLRPRSLRFVREQAAIEEWTALALDVATTDGALAREIVRCQHVLKGYGATYEHGNDSFGLLMTAACEPHRREGESAAVLARLREASLADEDGVALRTQLAGAGLSADARPPAPPPAS